MEAFIKFAKPYIETLASSAEVIWQLVIDASPALAAYATFLAFKISKEANEDRKRSQKNKHIIESMDSLIWNFANIYSIASKEYDPQEPLPARQHVQEFRRQMKILEILSPELGKRLSSWNLERNNDQVYVDMIMSRLISSGHTGDQHGGEFLKEKGNELNQIYQQHILS